MRDFRDAKLMAKALRSAMADDGVAVSSGRSLELIARAFGQESWNVLSARIKEAADSTPLESRSTVPTVADSVGGASALPQKLAQVELGCSDLAAAKTYYCDVLGLPLVGEIGDSIFVRCGELNLIVQQSANPRRGRTVYFDADGRMQEMAAALKARGVAFSQEPRRIARMHEGYDVWLGFFDDPWGNPLALLGNMLPA